MDKTKQKETYQAADQRKRIPLTGEKLYPLFSVKYTGLIRKFCSLMIFAGFYYLLMTWMPPIIFNNLHINPDQVVQARLGILCGIVSSFSIRKAMYITLLKAPQENRLEWLQENGKRYNFAIMVGVGFLALSLTLFPPYYFDISFSTGIMFISGVIAYFCVFLGLRNYKLFLNETISRIYQMGATMFVGMAASCIIFSAMASVIKINPIAAFGCGVILFVILMKYVDSKTKFLSPYQLNILSLADHRKLLYAIRPDDEVVRNKGLSQTILKALEEKFDSNTYFQIIEDVALESRTAKEITSPKIPQWAELLVGSLIVMALTALYEFLVQQVFTFYLSDLLCKIGIEFLCKRS